MDDGYAVGIDFFAYFLGRALAIHHSRALWVQRFFVNVFVVDGQQALSGAAFQREEVHAVMVHAHGVEQIVGAVIAVLIPGQGVVIDRRPPWGKHMGNVALGHNTAICHGSGQGLKTQLDACRWFRIGIGGCAAVVIRGLAARTAAITARQAKTAHGGQSGCQTTAHHRAARQADFQYFTEGLVLTVVAHSLVGDVFAHNDD